MKTNETLDLSGTLDGQNLPTDWTGASGVIEITNKLTKTVVVDSVALTTLDLVTRRWTYVDATKTLPVGTYRVEILVVFTGGGKRAFPNGYYSEFTVEQGFAHI